MPMINSRKEYIKGGVYHVYNRGVNKQQIFFDDADYSIFVYLLHRYLSKKSKFSNSFHSRIKLSAFCLMDNHFHLSFKQLDTYAIAEFMRVLQLSYTAIINKKYQRVGHLFQGVYKARTLKSDLELLVISKYIHLNPKERDLDYKKHHYSSIHKYLDTSCCSDNFGFVDTEQIKTILRNSYMTYESFIEDKIRI